LLTRRQGNYSLAHADGRRWTPKTHPIKRFLRLFFPWLCSLCSHQQRRVVGACAFSGAMRVACGSGHGEKSACKSKHGNGRQNRRKRLHLRCPCLPWPTVDAQGNAEGTSRRSRRHLVPNLLAMYIFPFPSLHHSPAQVAGHWLLSLTKRARKDCRTESPWLGRRAGLRSRVLRDLEMRGGVGLA